MNIAVDRIRDFLGKWETRQTVAYIPCSRRNFRGESPYDPARYGEVIGVSGVTVGTGLDLGQQAEADLRRMNLAGAFRERFRPYLGKRRHEAVAALTAAPLTLADMPFAACPPEAQAVIVSLFYQLGAGRTCCPKTWRLLCSADWPAASRELQTGFTRYARRRADEGRLIGGLAAGEAA